MNTLICVGLGADDRGFLQWYKENNPTGKIVAIDLNVVPYLGKEDYLVRGDLQKILPECCRFLFGVWLLNLREARRIGS